MSQIVNLTLRMPAGLAQFSFPKALDERLHHLLDHQNRSGALTPAEQEEAEGLAQMATTLSLLRLGAEVKSLQE